MIVHQVLDGQFTEAVELPVEFEVAVEGMDISQVLCEARRACAHWLKLHQKVLCSACSKSKKLIFFCCH